MCSLPQKFPYDVSTDFWCTNKTFLSPQLCTKGSLLWPQSRNAWENPLICNISLSSKSHFCSSTHFKVAKLHFFSFDRCKVRIQCGKSLETTRTTKQCTILVGFEIPVNMRIFRVRKKRMFNYSQRSPSIKLRISPPNCDKVWQQCQHD